MDYMEGGSVYNYLLRCRFREQDVRTLFKQLIQGANYMIQKGIVHRDYKLENLLFDEDFNIKIGDLGLCESIFENIDSEAIDETDVIQIQDEKISNFKRKFLNQ